MKIFAAVILNLLIVLTPAIAVADPDDRQDRRGERGRSDRQEEGVVGKDKRDCKQEEVRDGVRGNQGERLDGDSDNDD